MGNHVRLDHLDEYLKDLPEYVSAISKVRETAEELGIQDYQLRKILSAYREVEQIRADFLFSTGFPVKEKSSAYSC